MKHAWWQSGVVYQIYPRSFQDRNGDGVGDLPGVLARLDYLVDLGVDAVWLSPFYPSPMADFGYDVADYTGVDPLFGTLADFDRLIEAAHARGIKVLVDFVPNHSSVEHPWFRESRAARASAKRDWYIWRDPAPGGGPPNNWLSEFGGPAWTLDPATGQYYYHAFLREQPDLNWRNPAVRDAMLGVLRFWLDRGVDGFRVDAIHHLIKDDALRDNPPNPDWREGMPPHRRVVREFTMDRPEVHDMVALMRRVLDGYPGDRVLIGEAYLPIERLMLYYGAALDGFHLPFNFHLIRAPWDARALGELIARYEGALPAGGWPNWVLGNHDKSRVATRVGDAQARVAAMLLLTLRGTPTIYQGDELGLRDVPIAPDQVQDPWEKNVPGLGLGRDPERAPMPWSAGANAGFTAGVPWLPVTPDYATVNAEAQRLEPRSMLALHRALLALRRRERAIAVGGFAARDAGDAGVLAYEREYGGRRVWVALNLTRDARSVRRVPAGEVALSTALDRAGERVGGGSALTLRGDEGVVVLVA